jgi:hypothetical protein
MSLEPRKEQEIEQITATMALMRAALSRIEHSAPQLTALTLAVRHQMIVLNSQVQALKTTVAAERMTGAQPQVPRQASIEELPIFAHGHVLTALEVDAIATHPVVTGKPAVRMLSSLHRAGDHTLDEEEAA